MDAQKVLSVLDIYEQKMADISKRYPAVTPERADPTQRYSYFYTSSTKLWTKMSHV